MCVPFVGKCLSIQFLPGFAGTKNDRPIRRRPYRRGNRVNEFETMTKRKPNVLASIQYKFGVHSSQNSFLKCHLKTLNAKKVAEKLSERGLIHTKM